jgi:DNA-binding CsgD family transcriptional regulator
MTYTNDSVLHLIDLIYAAAFDPMAWTSVLEELQRMTGASGADLSNFALDRPAVNFSHSIGIVDAEFKREYLASFVMEDPWVKSMAGRGRNGFMGGTIGIGEALVPTTELKKTAFHNDFGRRRGYTGGLTAIIAGDGTSGSALNLCRREHQLFGDADGQLMRALMPHLQRAMQVHHRLVQAESLTTASLASLELSHAAVLLLDAEGRLRHATTAGAALLRERDGLVETGGGLRAQQRGENAALQSALSSAIHTAEGRGFGSGARLTLSRSSGRRPLNVVVSPSPVRLPVFTESSVAIVVFITDPERRMIASVSEIGRGLGITPAEARLARALAEGLSITEAAQRMSTTPGALRTRLKAIFAKTGTHRQADLVQLITKLLP